MNHDPAPRDWSRTPAAAFAAAVLGLASIAGIAWSVLHTQPANAVASARPDASAAAGPGGPVIVHLVDINTANAAELELLPGIGPATAAQILDDRAENGPYRSIDDLDRVRGIGPKTIARIRDRATTRED